MPKAWGQVDQCPLRGVADDLARVIGVQAGVVAEGGGIDQFLIDLGVTLGLPPATGVPWPAAKSPLTAMWVTVIWFRVRVPVLSLQITVALPRVSTAGSLRIRAFLGHTLHAQRHNDGGGWRAGPQG